MLAAPAWAATAEGPMKAGAPLASCLGALLLLFAYLGYSAERLDRFLPGEKALVESVGRFVFKEKPKYDGTLASVNRQDILIVQTAVFFRRFQLSCG